MKTVRGRMCATRALARLLCIGVVVVGTSGAAALADPPAPGPTKVTVCDLTEHGERFDGAEVEVSARAGTDGLEHMGIKEAGCPRYVVAIRFAKAVFEQPDVHRFWETLMVHGNPIVSDDEVFGTFTGRFHYRRDDFPSWILDVQGVTNVRIRKGAPHSR